MAVSSEVSRPWVVDRRTASPVWPVAAGLVAFLLAFVSVGYLHAVAPPSLNPIRDTVSDYVYVPGVGGLFGFAVVMTALGSAALLVGMRYSPLRAHRLSYALMGVWCAGLALLPTFPTDRIVLGQMSVVGNIHRYLAVIAFVALPMAGLGIATALCSHEPLRRLGNWIRWTCAAASFGVLVLVAIHLPAIFPEKFGAVLLSGFVERIVLVVDFGLLAMIAAGIVIAGRKVRKVSTVDVAR
ncbi:DUF998 domain-containing protein [Fodinicola acaciae]|uniref:DUF998 domain-containing protein n=1 Tax=Fodinicola acaciae TaxID=2681555 RepID=UPI0013D2291E|nr:DUF998 domain-containing protein [Fodinicola acaciae]